MKQVIVFKDDDLPAHRAVVESEVDAFRTKDSLIIREIGGATIEYNWDFIDRYMITDIVDE